MGSDRWKEVSDAATYSLTRDDVGQTLRVHVTAENVAGTNTATSPPVGPISEAPTAQQT